MAGAGAQSTGQRRQCIGHLPACRIVARGRRPAGRRAFRRGPGRRRWAVRLPPQATGNPNSPLFLPCVPFDQAREAIAIWLAILATHPPAGELQDGLGGLRTGRGFQGVEVRNNIVPTWAYPGWGASYITPAVVPQTTAAGHLLASAMTSLPEQKVAHVLKSAWASWLSWHTTDAQLAAALAIRMPSVPALPALPRTSGPGATIVQPGPGSTPQNPVCTA